MHDFNPQSHSASHYSGNTPTFLSPILSLAVTDVHLELREIFIIFIYETFDFTVNSKDPDVQQASHIPTK